MPLIYQATAAASKARRSVREASMSLLVEICVEGLPNARRAMAGGADRVELCENLAIGGVTPSAGAIEVARRSSAVPVHVLIRPRGGDFVFDAAELDAMRRDIETARAAGAAGVVLGVLNRRDDVDAVAVSRLVTQARPLSVTFHRAFDHVRDPFAALDTLIGIGVDRVLTSGRPGAARDAIDRIARLVEHAAGRITLLAGGRVTEHDFAMLAAAGVREVHIGSAACVDGHTEAQRVAELVRMARVVRKDNPGEPS
jgi:copper homeostasis protein